MQTKLVRVLLKHRPKFGLIFDEATSFSNIRCLIVYVRLQLPGMDNAVNVFVFLIEVANQTAEVISTALLDELHKH
jgi:hypothetical protein